MGAGGVSCEPLPGAGAPPDALGTQHSLALRATRALSDGGHYTLAVLLMQAYIPIPVNVPPAELHPVRLTLVLVLLYAGVAAAILPNSPTHWIPLAVTQAAISDSLFPVHLVDAIPADVSRCITIAARRQTRVVKVAGLAVSA